MNGLIHGALLAALGIAVFGALVFPLNALTLRRLSGPRHPAPASWPRVSVVIPARNEERGIEAAVLSQLAQDYPDYEVIVVDDRSTDRTALLLAGLQRADARLRIVRGEEPPEGWLGKPHALHQGALAATGQLLLFADADVWYAPSALREAVGFLEAGRLDFLALFPRFEMKGFWENVLMPYIPVTYFFGLGFLANSDAHRWIAAGGGAGNLVRRKAYDAVGGHTALRNSVIDDVRLAMILKRAGLRCRIARAEERVRVRMYRGFREIFDGFTKNVSFVFEGPFGVVFLFGFLLTIVGSVVPLVVLAAALAGAPIPKGDVALAAAGFGLATLLRALLAIVLRWPLWTAWTHPLMAAVWGGITLRSLYWRFVRRQLLWRGRRYDAARARF